MPYYLLEEEKLRRNLATIRAIAQAAGVEFILAFKAYALWKTFPIFKEYICHTTASSPYEARLAKELFGSDAHTYSPAYEESTFDTILRCSSHVTFNSFSQYERFSHMAAAYSEATKKPISLGLRINPEYSEIETAIYDPCAQGSRFGVLADELADYEAAHPDLWEHLDGFHCHCHCESDATALAHTLMHIEQKFGGWIDRLSWLNLGGGHLVTREGYDHDFLISLLRDFQSRHPSVHLILEPGSAFGWQTGHLVAEVVDIVCHRGIKTAILNVSFTCHMPDCLEMPYHPRVRGAQTIADATDEDIAQPYTYRLGGNSCLSGDYMGYWRFDHALSVGETIILEDMLHYTTVKTTMFNGIHHPDIRLLRRDGSIEVLRRYAYEDYRDRMD